MQLSGVARAKGPGITPPFIYILFTTYFPRSMADDFLTPEEIPNRLAEFKDRWYKVARDCESIKDFRSGREEGLTATLERILKGVSELQGTLGILNLSVKRDFPQARDRSEDLTERFLQGLAPLEEEVKKELDAVQGFRRLIGALEDATRMLHEAERRFREEEARTTRICTKYFEREREYSHQASLIKQAFEEKVSRIKGKYLGRLKEVCSGYDIFVAGKAMTVDDLFAAFVRSPSAADAVSLVKKEEKKSIFDAFTKKTEEDKSAKYEVLRYTAGEIASEVAPIKKEETQALVRLDSKFGDLRRLEMECKDAEVRMEDLKRPRDQLREDVKRHKKSALLALEKYDYILSIHDRLTGRLRDLAPLFKEYMEFVEEALGDYEIPEKDVEKRELKEEIRRLKGARKALEDEVITLNKKLEGEKEASVRLTSEVERLKKDLGESRKREEDLRQRVEVLEGVLEKLKGKVSELSAILED
jgi:chromosome segregation ATPase